MTDDEQDKPSMQQGKVETIAESGLSPYAAVLWVPDPEQRRGWREYYVRKGGQPPKPGGWGFA